MYYITNFSATHCRITMPRFFKMSTRLFNNNNIFKKFVGTIISKISLLLNQFHLLSVVSLYKRYHRVNTVILKVWVAPLLGWGRENPTCGGGART